MGIQPDPIALEMRAAPRKHRCRVHPAEPRMCFRISPPCAFDHVVSLAPAV